MLFFFFFFFFQAEDGIRDTSVTGVQTCALPISPLFQSGSFMMSSTIIFRIMRLRPTIAVGAQASGTSPSTKSGKRSEERRVGKECRAGGSREGDKKKRKKQESRELLEEIRAASV